MKILHTSDWHIGRKIEDKQLNETLEYFFDWLIDTINNNSIDVLIVAGDIFNNPFPGNNSLSLYYRTLYRLSSTKLKQVIITGGNHDSVSTINAPKELLEIMNISVIGGVTENIDDLIIKIKNKDEKTELIICAVPFLREKDLRTSISGSDYKERINQIGKGIENFYSEIGKKALELNENNVPIIATGHLFVNDVSDMSDEEKEIFIGGLQQVSYSQLPDIFDYIALGHIHKPMRVGKRETVRFSGSPIHMNFGEIRNKNQVVIIDFSSNEPKVEIVFIPVFRDLLSLKGSFKEIEEKLDSYNENKQLKAWASVEVIEDKIDPLMEMKINTIRDTSKNIEIIKLRYTHKDIQSEIEKKFEKNVSLNDLKPEEIFEHILDDVNEEEKENLLGTFNELVSNFLYNE
ncbi:MAG: exonuclease SbcCD subunit D C-terminal domain-containing protein [Bacteroidales bacterium]|nr:exonuclease SbcCD subunit D C-terminal domain-containing protein [Bacteroidales bacterium]